MTVNQIRELGTSKRFPVFRGKHVIERNDPILNSIQSLLLLSSPLHKKKVRYTKRLMDILFSSFLILLLFPWMIPLFGLLIKLNSKGPVFFLQKRNKQNGAVFNCIKFRTMVVNGESDSRSTIENDERITFLGKFLRHAHLDELPQLINVLIGDMSLIGPRPHMIRENIYFQGKIKEYGFRNEVKPGITGLSQSAGHFGYTDDLELIKQRIFLDLLYIKKWSPLLELRIILRTIWEMLAKLRKHSVKIDANRFKSVSA
jgi:putative colanic acid biosynthesis UDP-glucose lipid carrier transferase